MINNFDKTAYKVAMAEIDDLTQKAQLLVARGHLQDAAIVSMRASIVHLESRLKVLEDHFGIDFKLPEGI